ncbi:MAG TPA: hypothetical protein VGL13_09615, partial [Polyangiaceae bacterium]
MTQPISIDPASNPLLSRDAHEDVPRFDQLATEHVEPAVLALVARLDEEMTALERDVAPTWESTIAALTGVTEPLYFAWGVVGHLTAVKNSPELRRAHEAVQKDVVRVLMRVSQSEPVYRALKQLKDSAEWVELDPA